MGGENMADQNGNLQTLYLEQILVELQKSNDLQSKIFEYTQMNYRRLANMDTNISVSESHLDKINGKTRS